jgi:large subunit ribosomal protein L6
MSRVAKVPVVVPANVEVTVTDQHITIKGPKGTLKHVLHPLVTVNKDNSESNVLHFKATNNDPKARAQAGSARAIVNNMVQGVTNGFLKKLELVGVGYRAQAKGKVLTLSLGFSHPIDFTIPEGVNVETPNVTTIDIHGIDKQLVGQVASEIRAYRPPEPYKGKGVKYVGEQLVRKEAKKK